MGHSARLRAQQLRRNVAVSRAQIRADTASIMGAKTLIGDHLVEEWRERDLAGFRRFGLGVFITGPALGYNNASTLSAASACICGNTCEINVQSECRAGMPQLLRNDLGWDTSRQSKCCGRVPEIVEPNDRKPRHLQN